MQKGPIPAKPSWRSHFPSRHTTPVETHTKHKDSTSLVPSCHLCALAALKTLGAAIKGVATSACASLPRWKGARRNTTAAPWQVQTCGLTSISQAPD